MYGWYENEVKCHVSQAVSEGKVVKYVLFCDHDKNDKNGF